MYNNVKSKNLETGEQETNLDQIALLWLSEIQFTVKPSTYATYYNLIHSQIAPYFKGKAIKDMDSTLLYRFTDEKLKKGRITTSGGLSPKTVKDMLVIIRQVLNFASSHYLIDSQLRVPAVKIAHKNSCVLSKQEQKRLESYVLSEISCETVGVLICLYTGIRIGELCALKWSDIDFRSNLLRISRTAQRITDTDENSPTKTKLIIDTPKSAHSIRSIPLPDFLLRILHGLYSNNLKSCFILSGKPDICLEPRTYQYKFKRYLDDCNLVPVNFHALRHTFATRCIEENFDIKSLSEILGHANINITLNRYVHSSMEFKYIQMQRLNLLA